MQTPHNLNVKDKNGNQPDLSLGQQVFYDARNNDELVTVVGFVWLPKTEEWGVLYQPVGVHILQAAPYSDFFGVTGTVYNFKSKQDGLWPKVEQPAAPAAPEPTPEQDEPTQSEDPDPTSAEVQPPVEESPSGESAPETSEPKEEPAAEEQADEPKPETKE